MVEVVEVFSFKFIVVFKKKHLQFDFSGKIWCLLVRYPKCVMVSSLKYPPVECCDGGSKDH